jgi:integrase/recombinase XerD
MTPLRQRMLADLQLRRLSERTQEMDVRAVRQLAAHDHQSPDRITEEERRDYCRSLKNVTHDSRRASTIALGGITFVYEHTLRREWTTLTFVRAPRDKKLPVIRSREAGRTLLAQRPLLRDRVWLTTIDSCGLRLQDGTPLQVTDIDAARLCIPSRHGTGAKARDVPLPQRTRPLLRAYGLTHRHPVWIFPAPGRGGTGLSTATQPMPRASGPEAFRAALKASGIPTRASVHTRRHSWATPRREAGVNLRLMQAYRGHPSPATTALYTHLTLTAHAMAAPSINRLMADLSG